MCKLILFLAVTTAALIMTGCTVPHSFVTAVDAYDRAIWPVTAQALTDMPTDQADAVNRLHDAHRAMIDNQLKQQESK